MVWLRLQTIAATGIIATVAIVGFPAFAQEVETESESEPMLVESTITPGVDASNATTVEDIQIPVDQLKLLIKPLTVEDLQVEVAAWLLTLRDMSQSISFAEVAIKHEGLAVQAEQRAGSLLISAIRQLQNAEASLAGTSPGSQEYEDASASVEMAEASLLEAEQAVLDAAESADEALVELRSAEKHLLTEESIEKSSSRYRTLSTKVNGLRVRVNRVVETITENIEAEAGSTGSVAAARAEELEKSAQELKLVSQEQAELKNQLVRDVTQLELERLSIIERLNLMLEELETKGGDITSYQAYIDSVGGLELDITDPRGLIVRLIGWLTASNGGIRIGIGILKFGGILITTVVIAPYVGKFVGQLLGRETSISSLFKEFIVVGVKWGTIFVGALLALSSLGISLGPILALTGGASFILAFALQSNLGNFASGVMLLVNKPFDVGDEVKVAGYWAYVDSISLANTKLKDFSGNLITLPNNMVWGGDITNYTHSDIREISIGIKVKFSQDVNQIKNLWLDIAKSHPDVLADPAPDIFPWDSSYDYCIPIGLQAWSNTDVYWTVYVDLLLGLQQQLQEAGIELAAPLQEIKVDPASDKLVVDQLPEALDPVEA